MQKVIVCFIIAILMLALPELMALAMSNAGSTSHLVAPPGDVRTLGNIVGEIHESMAYLISFVYIMSYIAGLMFGLKGVVAYKEYLMYYSTDIPQELEIVDSKEIKYEKIEKQTEPTIDKKEIPLENRTGDEVIDKLISIIEVKSDALLMHPQIEENIQLKLVTQSSLQQYMPKVVSAYNAIPLDMRNRKTDNGSAKDMTVEQLELIIKGLDEIEENLLERSHDKLRINEKIINGAFKKPDYEAEME